MPVSQKTAPPSEPARLRIVPTVDTAAYIRLEAARAIGLPEALEPYYLQPAAAVRFTDLDHDSLGFLLNLCALQGDLPRFEAIRAILVQLYADGETADAPGTWEAMTSNPADCLMAIGATRRGAASVQTVELELVSAPSDQEQALSDPFGAGTSIETLTMEVLEHHKRVRIQAEEALRNAMAAGFKLVRIQGLLKAEGKTFNEHLEAHQIPRSTAFKYTGLVRDVYQASRKRAELYVEHGVQQFLLEDGRGFLLDHDIESFVLEEPVTGERIDQLMYALQEHVDTKNISQAFRAAKLISEPDKLGGGERWPTAVLHNWQAQHHPRLLGTPFGLMAPELQDAFRRDNNYGDARKSSKKPATQFDKETAARALWKDKYHKLRKGFLDHLTQELEADPTWPFLETADLIQLKSLLDATTVEIGKTLHERRETVKRLA